MEMKAAISKVKGVAVRPTSGSDEDGYTRDVVIFIETGQIVLRLSGAIRQDLQVGFGKPSTSSTPKARSWTRAVKDQVVG